MQTPLLTLTMLLAIGQDVSPKLSEVSQDFRNSQFHNEHFLLEGNVSGKFITHEKEGLRVTLTTEKPSKKPVGIRTRFNVKGDFELTATYDLLRADKPSKGYGAGITLYAALDNPAKEAITLGRMYRPVEGRVFFVSHGTTDANGKRTFMDRTHRADPKKMTGKLRIVRKKNVVALLTGERDGSQFEELQQFPVGEDDVRIMRIAADSGGASAYVDLRILDAEVKTEEFVASTPKQVSAAPHSPPVLLLGAALGIGAVVFVIMCAVGISIAAKAFAKKRRSAEPIKTPDADKDGKKRHEK